MSTNPFDSNFLPSSSTSISNPYRITSNSNPRGGGNSQQHYAAAVRPTPTSSSTSNTNSNSNHNHNNATKMAQPSDDPIWEARHVEWPLVSSCLNSTSSSTSTTTHINTMHHTNTNGIPFPYFKKFYKQSRIIGNNLGMTFSYNNIHTTSSSASSSSTGGKNTSKEDFIEGIRSSNVTTTTTFSANNALSGGFMGKFIGSSNQNNIGKFIFSLN